MRASQRGRILTSPLLLATSRPRVQWLAGW